MLKKIAVPAVTLCAALMLGACAADGLLGSGDSTAALPEKPKTDPACASLAAKIDGLRRDGASDRVAQAAVGKGETVSVKRASLAKVTELNNANTEFQAKCSNYVPTTSVNAPAPAPAAKTASVSKPAAVAAPKPAAQ